MPNWDVEWSVEVDLSLSKKVTVEFSHSIEAETAEEAIQQVQDDLLIDVTDIDIDNLIDNDDWEIDTDEDSFKVTKEVTELKW